jgi:uncharacterized protein (TIGR00369 family)
MILNDIRPHRDQQYTDNYVSCASLHHDCFICGTGNADGFRIHFELLDNGMVEGLVLCDKRYCGFTDRVHGGIIAALLDGAMANCLLQHGINALTAELRVRYLISVPTGVALTVRAKISMSSRKLYIAEAELLLNMALHARAVGKFILA